MTILFIFLVSISIASANSNPSSGFFFEGAFIDAKHKAGEEGKLFFVDFYANWCTPCKWMEESTFKNAEVINMLSTNYVALKIDIDDLDGYSIKQQFQVSVLPTILIFNSKGELIERVEETLSTGKMLALLEYHNKDDNKVKIKHAVNSSPKVSISSLSNERDNNHLSVKKATVRNHAFRIQLGVFKEFENTYDLVNELKSQFIEPIIVLNDFVDDKVVYKVMMGEFQTKSEATDYKNILERDYQIKGLVK